MQPSHQTHDRPRDVPVFLAYRAADGEQAAQRVRRLLHGCEFEADGERWAIRILFDQHAKPASDYASHSAITMRECAALVLIASPLAGRRKSSGTDELYDELERWRNLSNARAPITVNLCPEHGRDYLPDVLLKAWPKSTGYLHYNPDSADDDRLRDVLRDAIADLHAPWVESLLSRQRRRTRQASAIIAMLLVATIWCSVALVMANRERVAADGRHAESLKLKREALHDTEVTLLDMLANDYSFGTSVPPAANLPCHRLRASNEDVDGRAADIKARLPSRATSDQEKSLRLVLGWILFHGGQDAEGAILLDHSLILSSLQSRQIATALFRTPPMGAPPVPVEDRPEPTS